MDYLDKHGIEPADALHQFFDFLGSDVLLVANNNRFDLKMLQQECAKFDCAFESDAGIKRSTPFLPRRLHQVPRTLVECCAAKERQHHKTAPAATVPRKRKYDVPKILNPDFVAIESCRGRTAKMINRWRWDEPGLPSAICRTTTEVRFLEVALEMIVEQKGGLLDDLPLEHQHCTFCRSHLSW